VGVHKIKLPIDPKDKEKVIDVEVEKKCATHQEEKT
jgi:hypothetical protein